MNLTQFRLETDADGIALVTWDVAGKSMNLIDATMMSELEQVVDATTADAGVKGVVIASGKDSFSGGADLTMLEPPAAFSSRRRRVRARTRRWRNFTTPPQSFRAFTARSRLVESPGPSPSMAPALAAGSNWLWPAIIASWRMTTKTRVGLPEIKIGLFPGAGGTTRVARLMPTPDALQMLLKGDQIKPAAAKAKTSSTLSRRRAEIVAKAKEWIKAGGKGVAPWDVQGWKAPSGKIFSPGGMMIWPPANAIYRRETFDNYPAARAILQSVYEGLQLPMDLALRVESRWFVKILRSPEAAAMMRIAVRLHGRIEQGRAPAQKHPADRDQEDRRARGRLHGRRHCLCECSGRDRSRADRPRSGRRRQRQGSRRHPALGRRRQGPQHARGQGAGSVARIAPTADYAALAGVDLVVEAVFEDRAVKAEATTKALAVVGPDTIFASNTSTLPITSLAENWPKPENFVGVHFFSPVDKMLLVETILGAKTGDRALAVALDFVRAIKKTPIVVHDSRGFFANRCVLNYIREGHLMLMEGVPAAMIENVARMAGMPVGPLSLNDEVALDLGWRILQATKADLGAQAVDPSQEKLLEEMVVKLQRFGRKNGKGFYDYPEKGPKTLWPGLADLQPKRVDPDTLDIAEMKQRFLVVQAVEAARTVEEGVITDPREADVGSIIGFGFAPFTGGALSYIDFMGTKKFVALCDRLTAKYGERFAAPALLREMAQKGETFYGRFSSKQEAA